MNDIEWACEWVGWERISIAGEECWKTPVGEGTSTLVHDESPMLLACLAEAVRVKCVSENHIKDKAEPASSPMDYTAEERAAMALYFDGPIAFIKAVREVVD